MALTLEAYEAAEVLDKFPLAERLSLLASLKRMAEVRALLLGDEYPVRPPVAEPLGDNVIVVRQWQ